MILLVKVYLLTLSLIEVTGRRPLFQIITNKSTTISINITDTTAGNLKPTLSSSNRKTVSYHFVGNSNTNNHHRKESDESFSDNIFSKLLNCILTYFF